MEKAQALALHGEQLIQNNHYAVDSIRPKCVELRRICDDFTNETKKKYDILGKSLELHKQLDKVSESFWSIALLKALLKKNLLMSIGNLDEVDKDLLFFFSLFHSETIDIKTVADISCNYCLKIMKSRV